MVVLVTYKNVEDQIKNEGAKVATTIYNDFHRPFRCSWAANSIVPGGILPKFKLSFYTCPGYLQDFMSVFITWKNEEVKQNKQPNGQRWLTQEPVLGDTIFYDAKTAIRLNS